MHWHGQHLEKAPYMDGVPYVSQCPILPGSTFRYDYIAAEAGTHFWHSHIGASSFFVALCVAMIWKSISTIFSLGFQRGDGAYGTLTVRVPPKVNWHYDLYDIDEHTILISDWTHEMGIDKFLTHHHAGGDNKPVNVLINGLGRFSANRNGNNVSDLMPVATFTVKKVRTVEKRGKPSNCKCIPEKLYS